MGKVPRERRVGFAALLLIAHALLTVALQDVEGLAVTDGPYDKYNATFAGLRLAEKNGTSRPDDAKPIDAKSTQETRQTDGAGRQ